jgi:hypothetical protein
MSAREWDALVERAAEAVTDAHWCESNYTRGCNCREYRMSEARAVLDAVADDLRAEALREAADDMESIFRSGQLLGGPTDHWLRERADQIGPRHA